MKHLTQQFYFWCWRWITGEKECADRFEAGWTIFKRKN